MNSPLAQLSVCHQHWSAYKVQNTYIQCTRTHYNTLQYTTKNYNTIQYNTIQHNNIHTYTDTYINTCIHTLYLCINVYHIGRCTHARKYMALIGALCQSICITCMRAKYHIPVRLCIHVRCTARQWCKHALEVHGMHCRRAAGCTLHCALLATLWRA